MLADTYDVQGNISRFWNGVLTPEDRYYSLITDYTFHINASGIVTQYQKIDSEYNSNKELFLVTTENYQAFYDQGKHRYSHALLTGQIYEPIPGRTDPI